MLFQEDRRDTARRTKLLADMKAAIASHIERVCGHMDRDEFERLVERMALLEFKYTVRLDEVLFGRRAPLKRLA